MQVPLPTCLSFLTLWSLRWCVTSDERGHISVTQMNIRRTSERLGVEVRWEKDFCVSCFLIAQSASHTRHDTCASIWVCAWWVLCSQTESVLQPGALILWTWLSQGRHIKLNTSESVLRPRGKQWRPTSLCVFSCACMCVIVSPWVGYKWKNAINLPGHLWRDGSTLRFFTNIN